MLLRVVLDAVKPPERPNSPMHANLLNTKSKRSLDFTAVLSDSVEKSVEDSSHCLSESLNNGRCQLDNSFIVPLEESFTESTEVESLKRNMRSSDSSPDESKYNHELFLHSIMKIFVLNCSTAWTICL